MIYRLSPYVVDAETRRVTRDDGCRMRLSAGQFDALLALIEGEGRPVTRDALCQAALHRAWGGDRDRCPDQLIMQLRRLLPELEIQAVRTVGYWLQRVEVMA